MLNVLRLSSGVLKKLQLSDLAKLLLISSSTSTTTSLSLESTRIHIIEHTSAIHDHLNHHQSNDSSSSNCCIIAERNSNCHLQQNDENENITTMSSSPTSSSVSTTSAAAATFSSVVGSNGGINLKSEWSSTKSQLKESIDDSIKSYIVQDSNKVESCKIAVMSSNNSDNCNVNNHCDAETSLSSSSNTATASSSKGCEGSQASSCSKSPPVGKSCFTSSLADIIKFLELVGNLKHVKRTGWVLRDVKDCESISGHMYRMSMMTFLLDGTEGLDRTKCMELALVHDLAESLVGDITPFCGISKEEKKLREMKAMEDICKLIEPRGKRIYELFSEYEENETPESKFVKDLDRLDMVLQAFEYEKRDDCVLKHQEFFDSTDGKFSHPFVVKLVNEIYSQRQALAEKKTEERQQQQQQHHHHQQHHQQPQQKQCQNGFAAAAATAAAESNGDENIVQKKVSSS